MSEGLSADPHAEATKALPASSALSTQGTAPCSSPAGLPAALVDHPRYRVLELLGAGGMGAVYKAEHQLMERLVALKVISPQLTASPAMVERFRREVKAAARLTHPHIVAAYDAEQAGDTHFLVMEYVAGVSLARLLAERGRLPVAVACDYVRQAALGLHHAFERGMVHRDVKPHNLMVTPGGQVKVLDFGLARFAREIAPPLLAPSQAPASTAAGSAGATLSPEALTQVGTLLGTPDYLAPEQATDPHATDIRADVYSLGCTLYELLTGQPPFPGGDAVEKVMAHVQRTPPPLTQVRGDVPPEVARVVERMMAKDPARRYQTPAEVAAALAPFPARRWGVGRRLLVLAAVVLAGLGLAGYLLGPALLGTAGGPGHLAIEADDPHVQVIVTQAGKKVRVLDLEAERQIDLPAGEYEFELAAGSRADFQVSPRRLTLRPGSKEVLAVRETPGFVGEIRRFEGHTNVVRSVAFLPDGRRVLTGSGPWAPALPPQDFTMRLWDVATGRAIRRFPHGNVVRTVTVSTDGRWAASACWDKVVRLWDVETGQEVRRFEGHTEAASGVAISPDGKQVVSGGLDKALILWDSATGKEIRRFAGHTGGIHCVAFSPDGQHIASGSGYFVWLGRNISSPDHTVRRWNVASGKEEDRLEGFEAIVHTVAFSPDGRFLLAGSLGSGDRCAAVLWDRQTRKDVRRFEAHTVCFAPNSHRILFESCHDHTVHLWDVAGWRELASFGGHEAEVTGLDTSADGRLAVSCGRDGTVRLWRLPEMDQ
jgi:WD40 repeat protein